MKLRDLSIGQSAVVEFVGGEGELRQHFLDMGLIPGVSVKLVKFAPMGDPMELRIHDYELTLRLDDAAKITVVNVGNGDTDSYSGSASEDRHRVQEHPGLGEGGRYHVKADEHPLPKGSSITFALAGNQNCGKTTLFNQLTGSNQHVGNFPGVTVESKSGPIRGYDNTLVTDLPGIYSLSPYTSEEIVSRNFILDEKPTGIINITDATSIERNLYLTLQLMELDVPMVLALNMMDEVRNSGGSIDINMMESMLGIPVVPIAAATGEGCEELVRHAMHVAEYVERPGRNDFCDPDYRNGAVHRAIHGISHIIWDHAAKAGIPVRFAATKLIEGDRLIEERLAFSQNERETIEHMILTMEEESGLDRSAAIADMRYHFIEKLCSASVIRKGESRERVRSEKIDRILTGKYTAVPFFILIMGAVFWLTFGVIGAFLQGLCESGIESFTAYLDAAMASAGVNSVIHSLIIDGICSGVGSVLSFVPVVVTMFFFLSVLEDSGYMARVAFLMDKPLRKIGLSGRSIVPMLVGFGCTVPGVMSVRTLPSARDRNMTIMLVPFMSCSAKLPIYGLIAGLVFPGYEALVTILMYLTGVIMAIVAAAVMKKTLYPGEAVPFVMELPNYRMPGIKNVARLIWDKAKDFIERAFTIILVATVVIWFMQTFDFRLNTVSSAETSMLSVLAGFVAPVFAPLGLGDWRIVTGLVTGFLAKESVVSSLQVLFGSEAGLKSFFTPASGAAFLVFCLLYTPCVAAVAAIRREVGGREAAKVVALQCIIAWVAAMAVYLCGSIL